MNIFAVSDSISLPGRREELVQFFPTYGCRNLEDTGWRVHIHGWVYRPKENSLKRAAVLEMLRLVARLDRETLDAVHLKGRLRPFLYDNKRRRRLRIALGHSEVELPPSKANGHVQATVEVGDSEAADTLSSNRSAIPLTLRLPRSGKVVSAGMIPLIGNKGLSVISDIDDTIKISEVINRRALFSNTFLRDFAAAPGMAAAYRQWADAGATVHYVSASPWQLFSPLAEMLQLSQFPSGSVHLRRFRMKDRSLNDFLSDTDSAKRTVCKQLLGEFPRRRFVLVGDSGERDPEMYAGLARDFPAQIVRILIRNVTAEDTDNDRFRSVLEGLPEGILQMFDPETGPESDLTRRV